MSAMWKIVVKKFRSRPAPGFLINLWLMLRWRCYVHLGANIAYPGRVRIGKGASIGRCRISPGPRRPGDPQYSVEIGKQTAIGDFTILMTHGGHIRIGERVTLHPFSVLYGYAGVEIGDDTRIATSTAIIAENHDMSDPARRVADSVSGVGIRVGRDVWLGAGVKILDGVTIGDRAVVAAGAVVTRSVEPAMIVGGVPARPIKPRFATGTTQA